MTERMPFDDVTELFDRLGEELDEVGTALEGRVRTEVNVDVLERDEEFVVAADLPGYDADDIDLAVSGRELTLRADSDEETEYGGGDSDIRYHRRERRSRSATRRISLPGDVLESEAEASYERGVLTVTLPRPGVGSGEGTSIDVE
ncbi:heat-shock protein Hsp20 [Halobacteriales archaeon QS_6_71_20]|nr:MAG: heat-shock protein Hsp20 [Halobacteriales archaeon QS_6_71_20]